MKNSIQSRLLALVLSIVTAFWLIAAALIWFDTQHELEELLDGHLAQAAALLVVQQAAEIDADTALDAPSLHRYAPKVRFQVFHEGALVLRSAQAGKDPMIEPGNAFKTGFKTLLIDGAAWRVFAAHGHENDVQVYVAEEVASRTEILWALMRSTLWLMALALTLLAAALWWAIRQGLEPLGQLGILLKQRQAHALAPLALEPTPDELKPILIALNDLFGRIRTLMEYERRFTADAAHELRTPIAAIRIQAQVAQAECDGALRAHALQAILQGCDRAAHLVDQLLTLARLESGAKPTKERCELTPLIRQLAADCINQAELKEQHLKLKLEKTQTIELDNAIRYSPPKATIKITLSQQDNHTQLSIEDSGPGMQEDDLKRLGERFFRVLGTNESGSGLGWSIVQRIANVLNLQVHAQQASNLGGLKVSVKFSPALPHD